MTKTLNYQPLAHLLQVCRKDRQVKHNRHLIAGTRWESRSRPNPEQTVDRLTSSQPARGVYLTGLKECRSTTLDGEEI